MSEDLYSKDATSVNIPIPERRTYIPSWGYRHTDMGVQVKRDGVPLGFTVGQVLPERRWAIRPDGELMSANGEYKGRMEQWKSLLCAPDGTILPTTSHLRYFDPKFEAVPSPWVFVDAKPDPTNPTRYVPIAYQHPSEKPKLEAKYNHQGELVEEAGASEPPLGFVRVPVENEDPGDVDAAPFIAKKGEKGWYAIINTATGETVKKVRQDGIDQTIQELTT